MKRTITLLLAAMLAVGFSVAVSSPAHAAWACVTNTVCLWDGSSGTGALLFQQSWAPGQCVNMQANYDRANSFKNNLLSKGVQFYEHANCQGHAEHRVGGDGGLYDPFLPSESGTFFQSGTPICHCDRDEVSSLWFNN